MALTRLRIAGCSDALDHGLAGGYDRVERRELMAALAVAGEPIPNRWEHAQVEQPGGSTSEALGRVRTRFARVAVVLAIVGLSAYILSRRSGRVDTTRRPDPLSPYRNTAANVKYVGDTLCARCHGTVAASYRQHPMGRSLTAISGVPPPEGKFDNGRPLFVSHGLEYAIENRAGHVFHQESRRDATGQIMTRNEAEVHFVIGSGRRALGYLVERDGFLFESPITWYTQKQSWDLSPGFERTNNHFDRAISPTCLFCHANRVVALAGPDNRYEPPIFQGHAIGCERCHGPGELHAAGSLPVNGKDTTIVNPAGLEPSLRDAVCEQCHLGGEHRVVRTHRRAEDFRPGLPFDRFWTVFVERSSAAGERLIGQVEQMHASRCYRSSNGKLGCISCHDPHSLPPADRSVAYYRDRCLSCHHDRGCALAATARLKQSPDNNCASCHMPRMESSDVPHVATTNHRILRRTPATTSSAQENRSGRRLVPFRGENADARERRALDRDRGVALHRQGTEGAREAVRLLDAALGEWPDDLEALEARGVALGIIGRDERAIADLRAVLAREPNRESTLAAAAFQAVKMDQQTAAIAYCERVIAVNPWRSRYHGELALLYFHERDWHASARACRDALRLDPTWLDLRRCLFQCYLNLGEIKAAETELALLLLFQPPDRSELLRLFSSGARLRGPPG
jgi:hypothetical protein